MIDRGMTKDFEILEDGANMPDHLPVLMRASIQFLLFISLQNFWLQCVSGKLNGKKVAKFSDFRARKSR